MTEQSLSNQEILEGIDNTVGILQLVTGRIEDQPFWAYLSMYPTRYEEYVRKVQNNEPVNILDYGEILEEGRGTEPPPEVVEKMAVEYGAEPGFEEELHGIVEEALKEANSK